jgi:hypothetical protein
MLDPQVVMNLLPEFAVGVYLMRHGNGLVKDLSVARDIAQRWRRERAP